MSTSPVTTQFRRVREEVLKSLASPDAVEELAHRRLAGCHLRRAMRELRDAPDQKIDWSLLDSARSQ